MRIRREPLEKQVHIPAIFSQSAGIILINTLQGQGEHPYSKTVTKISYNLHNIVENVRLLLSCSASS